MTTSRRWEDAVIDRLDKLIDQNEVAAHSANHIHQHFINLEKKVSTLMSAVSDVKKQMDDLLVQVTENDDLDTAMKTAYDFFIKTIKDQNKQIADLIAAGGASPAELQAVLDVGKAISEKLSSQKLVEASLANTDIPPDEPPPPPPAP